MKITNTQLVEASRAFFELGKCKPTGKLLYSIVRSKRKIDEAMEIYADAYNQVLLRYGKRKPGTDQLDSTPEQQDRARLEVESLAKVEIDLDVWPIAWADAEKLGVSAETLALIFFMIEGEPSNDA
jgi:hypothetical protein